MYNLICRLLFTSSLYRENKTHKMKESKIKIAALQMESTIGDVDSNHKKVRCLLKDGLLEFQPNIIILPEVWTVGWDCSKFIASAEDFNNSKTIEFLSDIALQHNCYVLGGSLIEKDDKNYFNTCPVISPEGVLIAKYRKNHLFSYYGCNEGSYVRPGTNPLLINILGIKIGLSICYDIRFPELYRAYRHANADLLVNMAAWPLNRKYHWLSLTRARAIENQCFMVALTQTGTLSDGSKNLGHSLIYDYNGEILDQIETKEGIIKTEFATNEMYKFREKCTILKDIHSNYEVKEC